MLSMSTVLGIGMVAKAYDGGGSGMVPLPRCFYEFVRV
jgi:hypothetical protein